MILMSNNKPKGDSHNIRNGNDDQDIQEMTSEELIESIRGKIQRVLVEKAKDPGYSEK